MRFAVTSPVLWLSAALAAQPAFAQAPAAHTPLSAAQWREDLRFVVSTVKAVHPRPFHRVPESAFDSAARAIEVRLGRQSDIRNAIDLIGLVSLINDGHTTIHPGGPLFRLDRWYPIRIDRLADGIFVVAAAGKYRDLLGAEVRTIGGREAADVWGRMQAMASGDNPFSRMARVPIWLSMPELAHPSA